MSAVHPAALSTVELLAECEVRRQRRSGPGGQHRNKVETAVVLVHRPTGIRGEASERRSQAANHKVAVQRLRVTLALRVRLTVDEAAQHPSDLWKSRVSAGLIVVSASHADFPALLAESLDTLSACGFDCQAAGERLSCSASQLLKFLKLESEALQSVNKERVRRNLRPLR